MPESAEVKIISDYLSSVLLNKRVIEIKISENYSKKVPKNLHYLIQNLPLKCHGIMIGVN